MGNILGNLQPTSLWNNFEAICGIPHPSKHEAKLRDFVVGWAKSLNLETIVDEVGNVIIRKPATKGMEDRKGIILQAHLDMVPQKNNDTKHDFEKDPIIPWIDSEWVKAKGTTLGADNGIGMAAAMAVLEAKDLTHGPIEALFTVDEETGMTGAFGLKAGLLKGDILMNLDSEDEGELYVGCAGGTNANLKFKYGEELVPANSESFKLNVGGLKGGHSGVDIALERGNSNKILTRILWHAHKNYNLRISLIDGGSLRNAIPRESFAVITLPKDKVAEFKKFVEEFSSIVINEYKGVETDIKITVEPVAMPANVIDLRATFNFLNAVYATPNGVMRMSQDMIGLVETSTNLATIKSENGEIKIQCLLRSSVDSAKEDLEHMVESVYNLAGAEAIFDGQYPGWKPNMDSPILKEMLAAYEKQFGNKPKIAAIHAGLECGLLGGVYKNWDMISFGPTIRFPHSPDEKVNVPSVKKFWDFLTETLKNAPKK
ncbi:MAG TPA: aminoacyl-histidine dipeptidase [Bacteroidales bacterium]|nr:aminoacyl-histidine dipeptidase [Bacteroidales bacterium]HPS18164.1 aminoacyl-histidine dipeptidase [Bacteroidales bacterium]